MIVDGAEPPVAGRYARRLVGGSGAGWAIADQAFSSLRSFGLGLVVMIGAACAAVGIIVLYRPLADTFLGSACDATVAGADASAVHQARDVAGVNGTVCFPGGTYTGDLRASVSGQTWLLSSAATITGQIVIAAPSVTLEGGIVAHKTTAWAPTITVAADNATIRRVKFQSQGLVVSIRGVDGTHVIGNTFTDLSNTAVFIWGDGRGADDTLIQGNTIRMDGIDASPIASRGSESPPYTVWNRRTIVRDNDIDQGLPGHFGIELVRSPNSVVEGNTVRGGACLVSLPDSDNSVVIGNTLELQGMITPFWGVEIAHSVGVVVELNTGIGSSTANGHFVSINTNSYNAQIRDNTVSNLRTLVDLGGDSTTIIEVASRICCKSSDGTGSLARAGYAIARAVSGTARAAMRPAIA